MIGPISLCFKPQICWISKVSDLNPTPKINLLLFHFTFALLFILDDTEIFSVICLQMKLVILIISENILKLMRKTPKTLPRLFCVPHQQFLLLSLIFVNKQTPLTSKVGLKMKFQIKIEKRMPIKSIWRRVSFKDGALSNNSLFVQLNSCSNWWC